MGMFDKDKEIGRVLTDEFTERQEFILYGVSVDKKTVPTDLGEARKTRMEVAKMDDPSERFECTSLGGAIADKAEQAEGDDFPAVVEWRRVASKKGNDATVLQFIRPWKGQTA